MCRLMTVFILICLLGIGCLAQNQPTGQTEQPNTAQKSKNKATKHAGNRGRKKHSSRTATKNAMVGDPQSKTQGVTERDRVRRASQQGTDGANGAVSSDKSQNPETKNSKTTKKHKNRAPEHPGQS